MRGVGIVLYGGMFCAGVVAVVAIILDCRNGALVKSSYPTQYLDRVNQSSTWHSVAPVWFFTLVLVGFVELICTAFLFLLSEPHEENKLQRNEESCETCASDQQKFKEASVAIGTLSVQDHIVETQINNLVTQPDVQTATTSDTIKRGDVVRLHTCQGISPEFWNRCAVVKEVHAQHCDVVVLDNESRYCLGESWPNLCDVTHMSQSWRLGSKVWCMALLDPKHEIWRMRVAPLLKTKDKDTFVLSRRVHPAAQCLHFVSVWTSQEESICLMLDFWSLNQILLVASFIALNRLSN